MTDLGLLPMRLAFASELRVYLFPQEHLLGSMQPPVAPCAPEDVLLLPLLNETQLHPPFGISGERKGGAALGMRLWFDMGVLFGTVCA